jgi:hypothetical protein
MVYILTTGSHEDYQIHGVFEEKEDAERAIILWGICPPEYEEEYISIEEEEIVKIPQLPDSKLPFMVRLSPESDYCLVMQGWKGRTSTEESYTFSHYGDNDNTHTFFVWAENKKEAEEIAKERLLKLT